MFYNDIRNPISVDINVNYVSYLISEWNAQDDREEEISDELAARVCREAENDLVRQLAFHNQGDLDTAIMEAYWNLNTVADIDAVKCVSER